MAGCPVLSGKAGPPPSNSDGRLSQTLLQPALIIADERGIIESVNLQAMQLFGYSQDELMGNDVSMLMPSPYREQHHSYIHRYLQSGQPKVLGSSRIVEALHKDGYIITLRFSLSEARSRLALEPSQVKEQRVFIAMFEPLDLTVSVEMDHEGRIVGCSKNIYDIFGRRRKELIGKDLGILMPAPYRQMHTEYVKQYLARKGQPDAPPTKVLNKVRNLIAVDVTGEKFPISLRVTEKEVAPGAPPHFVGYIQVVDQETEAWATIDSRGIILSVNDGFTTLCGFPRTELVGKNISVVIPPPHAALHDEYIQRYVKTRQPHIVGKKLRKVHMKHKDGSLILISLEVNEFQLDGQLCFRGRITRMNKRQRKRFDQDDDVLGAASIGMYLVDRTVGSGTFGNVQLCTHKLTGEKVAVKTLKAKQYAALKMPFPPKEVAILTKLRHPNICALWDVINAGKKLFLIQEFAAGGDLFHYIINKGGPLEESEARKFFRQMLSAVNYMHRHNIVHRDLKVENVLLDERHNIKVIDFGLSNFFDTKQPLSSFCGTPDYAPPELWNKTPYSGPPVDVWGLGCLLYIMLFGRAPFARLYDIINVAYSTKCDKHPVSPSALDLLKRIFVRDPSQRATIAEIARHPWVSETYNVSPLDHADDPPLVLNPRVLAECVRLGFREEDVITALNAKQTDQLTTTYFLLENRFAREALGGQPLVSSPSVPEDVQMASPSGSITDLPSSSPTPMALSDPQPQPVPAAAATPAQPQYYQAASPTPTSDQSGHTCVIS